MTGRWGRKPEQKAQLAQGSAGEPSSVWLKHKAAPRGKEAAAISRPGQGLASHTGQLWRGSHRSSQARFIQRHTYTPAHESCLAIKQMAMGKVHKLLHEHLV